MPVLYPQTSQITELKVKTLREEAVPTRSEDEKDKYIVEKELSSLWHGEVKKVLSPETAENVLLKFL